MKNALIVITVIAVALAGYFGYEASQAPSEEELQQLADLEAALKDKEAQALEESKRAAALAEAKRLAEEAAKKASEAEAARLNELAEQIEREKQEKTRLEGLVTELNTKTETIVSQQKDLQDALARARLERERAAVAAEERVRAAEAKIARVEATKQSEIEAARAAALEEALARMEARAERAGYTPATEVVTERRQESISAFLAVSIKERNFSNNTRRTQQRRQSD